MASVDNVEPEKVNEEMLAAMEAQSEESLSPFVDLEIHLPSGTTITIPNVYTNDSLNSIKQGLLEFQETAFYTAYNLQFRHGIDVEGNKTELPKDVNSYVELSAYLSPDVRKCVVDLKNESYDIKKARNQVKRTRDAIAFPPLMNSGARTAPEDNGKTEVSAKDAKETLKASLPKLETLIADIQLGDFYRESLLRTGKNTESSTKKLGDAIKSISTSGWNPPPANRKIQGDLMYLEVVTATEGTFQITVTSKGFYVNKSNRNHFDASPATHSHYHHELFDTLLGVSASLRNIWSAFREETTKVVAPREGSALDLIATVYAQGRGDLAASKVQWNVMPTNTFGGENKTTGHTYDLFRAQEDASSLHGVEELGASREWNDEIQSLRALPVKDVSEKTMKMKLEYKIITDFTEACKSAVLAISEGAISPITDTDPTQSDIYVYNGIFYSKAEDTKDSFKICNGDETFRKCTGKDLQNQKYIQSLGIDGVSTVLCTVVDYKGQRYIGQSIIPGIFTNGDHSASLMHGMLDKNKPITVKNGSFKIMEQVAKSCYIPTRNINRKPFSHLEDAPAAEVNAASDREPVDSINKLLGGLDIASSSPIKVDEIDSIVAPDAETTPHVGPIEGKLLKGADGRLYALEVMRLTPRDANYVHSEKNTGKLSAELLAKTDKDLAVAYVLRKELIQIFAQRKISVQRQALMVEANVAEEKFKSAILAKRGTSTAEKTTEEGKDEKKELVYTPEEEAEQSKLANEFSARFSAITAQSLNLEINPNVFLDFVIDTDAEVVTKDEALVKEISTFLWDTMLPIVVKNVREGEVIAKDGLSLSQLLHKMGVNLRYMGQLAKLAKEQEEEDKTFLKEGKQRVHQMPLYFLELLTMEIIARAVKHVLNSYYKNKEVAASPARTIVSLLNHLFSTIGDKKHAPVVPTEETEEKKDEKSGKKKNTKSNGAAAAPVASVVAAATTHEVETEFSAPNAANSKDATLSALSNIMLSRFCINVSLSESTAEGADLNLTFLHTRISPATLLRRICQASGIRIATRNYDFSSATPFNVSDVWGLTPIVKTCEPENLLPEFQEMMNSSLGMYHQGNFGIAYEFANQAYTTINSITGVCHPTSLTVNNHLTDILLQVGDYEPAIQMCAKSLAVAVQLEGLDSHEAATQHAQLSVIYSEVQNASSAIQHLLAAKYLVTLLGGPRHPELAGLYARLATMYEATEQFELAFQCLNFARALVSDLFKNCLFTTAIAEFHYRRNRFADACACQKNSYMVLKELLPEEDPRRVEAKNLYATYLEAMKVAEDALIAEIQQRAQLQAQQATAAPAAATAAIEDDGAKKKNNNSKKNKSKK